MQRKHDTCDAARLSSQTLSPELKSLNSSRNKAVESALPRHKTKAHSSGGGATGYLTYRFLQGVTSNLVKGKSSRRKSCVSPERNAADRGPPESLVEQYMSSNGARPFSLVSHADDEKQDLAAIVSELK